MAKIQMANGLMYLQPFPFTPSFISLQLPTAFHVWYGIF